MRDSVTLFCNGGAVSQKNELRNNLTSFVVQVLIKA